MKRNRGEQERGGKKYCRGEVWEERGEARNLIVRREMGRREEYGAVSEENGSKKEQKEVKTRKTTKGKAEQEE